jgi:hypothetical protein
MMRISLAVGNNILFVEGCVVPVHHQRSETWEQFVVNGLLNLDLIVVTDPASVTDIQGLLLECLDLSTNWLQQFRGYGRLERIVQTRW